MSSTSSILIILLIVVITVVILIICRILRHVSSSSGDDGSSRVSSRRVSPAGAAAAPDPVASLPVFAFSTVKRRRESSAADCAVCLSRFEDDDQLRLLPLCCHAFHVSCVDTWLQSQQTCPLCRSPIALSDSELMTLVDLEIGNELPPPLPSEASLAADVAGRSWLKEFVDRISSSGRFFTGSSRRSEIGVELSEYFRWLSEV